MVRFMARQLFAVNLIKRNFLHFSPLFEPSFTLLSTFKLTNFNQNEANKRGKFIIKQSRQV